MSKDDSVTFHHFVKDKRIYSHSVFVERRYTHVVIVTDVRNVSSLHAYSDGNGCGGQTFRTSNAPGLLLFPDQPMQNVRHHFN